MTIECYYASCPFHGVNTDPNNEGPFCYESECQATPDEIDQHAIIHTAQKRLAEISIKRNRQLNKPVLQVIKAPIPHVFYETKDEDKPSQICDSNGQVVLSLCRVCGQAEGDLDPFCVGIM